MSVATKRNDKVKSEKKRKRIDEESAPASFQSCNDCNSSEQNKKHNVLNGLILAVSSNHLSSPVKDAQHDNSYKTIVQELKEAGATISSQVHKRVHALVISSSNKQDTEPATQRVRKAVKFNLNIVHVSWIRDSVQQGKRLPIEPYLWNTNAPSDSVSNNNNYKLKGEPQNTAKAQMIKEESISLGCCCACHDISDIAATTDCPWCVACG